MATDADPDADADRTDRLTETDSGAGPREDGPSPEAGDRAFDTDTAEGAEFVTRDHTREQAPARTDTQPTARGGPSPSQAREDRLQRAIEDAEIEGWSLDERRGDRAIMVKRGYGSLGAHILVALLTIWWTLGIGNIAYAAYVYFSKADKKVIRAEDI